MTVIQQAVTGDQGERQAVQLADRLRALAKTDPDLAQHLVEDLIEKLNTATEGLFDEYIERAESDASRDRAEIEKADKKVPNQGGAGEIPTCNS